MWLLLLAALTAGAQERLPEKASVSGVVMDAITGSPLGKAAVSLEPIDRAGRLVAATTSDSRGSFELVDIEPGLYHLKAKRSGYLEIAYGARRPETNGSRLRIEAGQALRELQIRLTPGGVISGTVRDSDGDVLEGARVILAQFNYETGVRAMRRVASADTDDRGEYRFHGLAAGKYYVGVARPAAAAWNQVDRSRGAAPAEMSVATLFAGVTDLPSAAPVELRPGQRAVGIDVTLVTTRVFHVAGRIVNPPGRPVSLELRDARSGGLREFAVHAAMRNESGDFEFRGVSPGSYYLQTVADSLHCRLAVTVGAADVEGLRVTLAPGATIERLSVAMDAEQSGGAPELSIALSGEGETQSVSDSWGRGGVLPGRYSLVRFSGRSLREAYVKSIRAGDTDVLTDGLAVEPGAKISIAVTLARNGAALSGTVSDSKSSAVPGATVVLVPADRARAYLFRTTTSDQSGRYEFVAIPPGEYKIFAWDDVEPESWRDPDFVRRFENHGEKAGLEADARKTVDVRLAAPEE